MEPVKLMLLFRTSDQAHPHPPIAQILPKSNNITPKCYTFNELNTWIDLVIKDLEIIRKQAKDKFTRHNREK